MGISNETAAYIEDRFSVVPDARIRKMFGGIGVFRHGLMFAVALDDGRIAFKADEKTVPEFEKEGSVQWVYEHKNRRSVSMGYWYAPERLADDSDAFAEWAEKAFQAAVRIDQAKPPSQRKLKT